jgi:glycosyltransferase involved in cell wall biosynthesis
VRIVQLTQDWSLNGGVARYVRDLTGALGMAGHDVTVIHADPHAPAPEPGMRAFVVEGFTDYRREPARAPVDRVLTLVEQLEPDMVHVHANNNFLLEAELRRRYPAIKTLHVYDFCPTGNKFHYALDRPCDHPTGWACVPRMAYKRCTRDKRPHVWWHFYRRAIAANANNAAYAAVLVTSEYVRRQALASGYPPAQVRTLPCFTVLPQAIPPPPVHPGTMLFCGRLSPEKGLDLLLRAAARLDRPWRLLVAGDGMERGPAEHLARRLGVADRVEFRGWTDRAALSALYANAAVVAVPSRWPEPFGIVGLEAMSHGRPVVAFAVGGIPEWLDDGVNGFLIRPYDIEELADRLQELLDAPERARTMGERGRARVEHDFTAARHVDRLLAIYEETGGAWRGATRRSTKAQNR